MGWLLFALLAAVQTAHPRRGEPVELASLEGLLKRHATMTHWLYVFGGGTVALEGEDENAPNQKGGLEISVDPMSVVIGGRGRSSRVTGVFDPVTHRVVEIGVQLCRPDTPKCPTVSPEEIRAALGVPGSRSCETGRDDDAGGGVGAMVKTSCPAKPTDAVVEVWQYPTMRVLIESRGVRSFAGVILMPGHR